LNARKTSAAREIMEQKASKLYRIVRVELHHSLKGYCSHQYIVVAFVFTLHFLAKSRTCKLFNRD
jgi:hypothetical protein